MILGKFMANGRRAQLVATEKGLDWRCEDKRIGDILKKSMRADTLQHPDSLGYPYWWFGLEALKDAGIKVSGVKAPPRESMADDQVGVDGNPIP